MGRAASPADLPEDAVLPASRDAWRSWLEANHDRRDGIWLVRYRKGVEKPSVNPEEAIEEALCFGWIDSLPRALDDERTMLYFAPRKPGSNWSRLNRERVGRMVEAGRMAPPGRAKVEAARADGSWLRLEAVERLEVPDDLEEAFQAHPGVHARWEAFPPSTRRAILEWIVNAKRDATRARRVEETARLAQQGIRANPWTR